MLLVFLLRTGRVAALSMMGRAADIKAVPYFWSAMFGKTIRYAGRRLFGLEFYYEKLRGPIRAELFLPRCSYCSYCNYCSYHTVVTVITVVTTL